MAFKLSNVREAIQKQDLELLEKSLEQPVSQHVLQEAFVDLLGHIFPSFRLKASSLLLGHGLSPQASPPVELPSRNRDSFSARDQDSMRLPYDWMFISDVIAMPLASRAAMVDAVLLEALLEAGANPRELYQLDPGGAHSSRPPLGFGSVWGSALALVGRPEGELSLKVLEKHDPLPWEDDLELVKDALRVIIRPGTHKAPPAQKWGLEGARIAWGVVEKKVPDWPREKWAEIWADSMAWRSFSVRSQDRARIALLAQALPAVPLAGLFDACHDAKWDLRELALEAALGGDMGCWETLERHSNTIRLNDFPQWGERKLAWKDAKGTLHKQTVPLDGLGCLLLKVRWPSGGGEVYERADEWLKRLGVGANRAPMGKTLAQWRMVGAKNHGAPIEWMARHEKLWEAHPETGRTPWHESGALELTNRLPSGFIPDWLAMDIQGQEAGATALAIATSSQKTELALKALKEDRIWANGACMGRHASTWVAFHSGLKKAYRESCKRRGFKPPRGVQSQWRLHAAAQAMSPPRVRVILERLSPQSLHQALLETDELGRTPLLWWATTPPEIRQDGTVNKAWDSRAQRVFSLLTPPGVPLWKEGMEQHPYMEYIQNTHSFTPFEWTAEIVDTLATDFGSHMRDRGFRNIFLPKLVEPLSIWAVEGLDMVWKAWRPDAAARRATLVELWNFWGTAPESSLWKNRIAMVTSNILKAWEKFGDPLDPEDLRHPRVAEAFARMKKRFPDEADVLKEYPVIEAGLHGQAMEEAISKPLDVTPSRVRSGGRF